MLNKWWLSVLIYPTISAIILFCLTQSLIPAALCWVTVWFINYTLYCIKDLYEQIERLKK